MPLSTTPKFITTASGTQIDGLFDVAASGTGFVVAFHRGEVTTGQQTILLQRYDGFGNAAGKAITLDGPGLIPGRPELVDLGANKMAAFWESGGNIVGKVVNLANGTAGALKIITETDDLFHDAVLLGNGRIALTVSQTDATNPFNIREKTSLVVLDANLNVVKPSQSVQGEGTPLDAINEFDATVVDTATGGLAIYRDRGNEQLFAHSFDGNGKLTPASFKLNTTTMKTPTVFDEVTFNVKAAHLDGGNIMVTWTSLETTPGSSGYEIRARVLNANGVPLDKDFLVNQSLAGTQYYPEVHAYNGGFAVTWIEDNLVVKSHMIRYFNASGAALSDAILTEPPSVAATTTDDGSTVLADGSIVEVTGTAGFGAKLLADGIPKPVFGTTAAEIMGGTTKADMIIASGGNDTVAAGAGNDVLDGMNGNDKLVGQVGSDVLIGGNGRDFFMFSSPLSNDTADRVLDFNVADDAFLLDDAVFPGLPRGALAASAFHSGNFSTAPEQRIIYDSGDGILLYDPDGNGPQAAVKFAFVTANLPITAADFLVV